MKIKRFIESLITWLYNNVTQKCGAHKNKE